MNTDLGYNRMKMLVSTINPTFPKFCNSVENKVFKNIVGKGENASNHYFLLLFPTVFYSVKTKSCHIEFVIYRMLSTLTLWNFVRSLTLSQTSPCFYMSAVQVCWKHWGKRRICSLQAISPFPTVFSTLIENFVPFLSNLELLSGNYLNLETSKIRLGRGWV